MVGPSPSVPQRIDSEGWPLDPVTPPAYDWWLPDYLIWPTLKPSAIPLSLVCGPPAAGKSTWVEGCMVEGDTLIDLDLILVGLGCTRRTDDKQELRLGLIERNKQLNALAHATHGNKAWFITGAPSYSTRRRWAGMLEAVKVVVVPTPELVCIERVMADRSRLASAQGQVTAIRRWWKNATFGSGETHVHCV